MNPFPLHPPGDVPAAAAAVGDAPPDVEATVEATVAAIAAAVRRHRFRFDSEKELQGALEVVIEGAGLTARREHALAPGDVIDFLVAGGVGVEVKVGGDLSGVTRQLHRYAGHDAVKALVLVTSRRRLGNLPGTLRGKPVAVVVVDGAFQ